MHADPGPQSTSEAFPQRAQQAVLILALGSVGDSYDNGVMKSFWGCLQVEPLIWHRWYI